MSDDPTAAPAIVAAALPRIRAAALLLCGDPLRADGLVQDTVVKAFADLRRSDPAGLPSMLLRTLGDLFRAEHRTRRYDIEDPDGTQGRSVGSTANPAFEAAFDALSRSERDALLLVEFGTSYADAAIVCGCSPLAVRSRVRRARLRLANSVSR